MKTFQQFMEQSKLNMKANFTNTTNALQGMKDNKTINAIQNQLKSGEINIGKIKNEVGDGKERRVKEKSHVIDRGKMGKRKFKKAVKKLGKKYGQDSVLTQTKKTATLSATRKGGLGKSKGINVGRFKPQGKNPEGQSQIKGKTFAYG